MDTLQDTARPAEAQSAAVIPALDKEQRGALLEYLTELVPIEGVIYTDEDEETMHLGRAAIRRVANGSVQWFSLADCADVAALLSHSEPRTDPFPIDSRDYVGFMCLMQTLEGSLRTIGGRSADKPDDIASASTSSPSENRDGAGQPSFGNVPAIPVSLIEDDLSARLMNAAGIVGTVRNALDEDNAEECAALAVAVSMLHGIDDELDTACWRATRAFDSAHPDHPAAIERRRVLEGMRTTPSEGAVA